MGNCIKLLHESKLPKRSITPASMWGDLCENIHLHVRNLRIEFSKEEFDNTYNAMTILSEGIKRGIETYDWKPGGNNTLISFDNGVRLSNDSDYHADRLRIELEKNDEVHIHYRESRLHLTKTEFHQLADALIKASNDIKDNHA